MACAATAPAWAAGGQFDVDDAAMLVPGHCQVELWVARPADGSPVDAHVGPACRVGPVELALNVDHLQSAEHPDWVGPQVKWVIDPIAPRLSAGLVWGAAMDLRHGGRPAQLGYAVATWFPAESLQVHGNLGADWAAGGGERTRRLGLSLEWAASDALSLIGERLVASTRWRSRLGARFNLSDTLSLDLAACTSGAPAWRGVGIGLNREFSR